MSNIFSLESMKEELDKEFAPLQLELGKDTLTLRNLMRISDTDRETVLNALDSLDMGEDDDEDRERTTEEIAAMSAAITEIFLAVTANGKGQKLVDYIDGDLQLSMKVMEKWTEATQPGEAQNSPA